MYNQNNEKNQADTAQPQDDKEGENKGENIGLRLDKNKKLDGKQNLDVQSLDIRADQ